VAGVCIRSSVFVGATVKLTPSSAQYALELRMRFSVPQFIDVEDKIFGQFTLRQGIYIAGSVGFAVAVFLKFGLLFAVLLGGPVLLLAFLLSFVKIHGRPFINMLFSASLYFLKNKLYLWKKTTPNTSITQTRTKSAEVTRPVEVGITQSKLKELAWSLDAKDSFERKKSNT
jgi:hypothetical protein